MNDFGPMMDAKTDELRAKVDLARERMISCARRSTTPSPAAP